MLPRANSRRLERRHDSFEQQSVRFGKCRTHAEVVSLGNNKGSLRRLRAPSGRKYRGLGAEGAAFLFTDEQLNPHRIERAQSQGRHPIPRVHSCLERHFEEGHLHDRFQVEEPADRDCAVKNVAAETGVERRPVESETPAEVLVRSRFIMNELRRDTLRTFAGRYRHWLIPTGDSFRIKLQRVDMVNAQAPYEYVLQTWV